MSTPPPPFGDEEQAQFARFLRERLPRPLTLYALTEYARRVLGLPTLLHWRGLTRAQAQQVMQAAQREYPRQP